MWSIVVCRVSLRQVGGVAMEVSARARSQRATALLRESLRLAVVLPSTVDTSAFKSASKIVLSVQAASRSQMASWVEAPADELAGRQ